MVKLVTLWYGAKWQPWQNNFNLLINILEILPVDVVVLFFVSVSCYILRTMWENGLTEILKMLLLFIVKEEKVKATYNNLLQHSFNAK